MALFFKRSSSSWTSGGEKWPVSELSNRKTVQCVLFQGQSSVSISSRKGLRDDCQITMGHDMSKQTKRNRQMAEMKREKILVKEADVIYSRRRWRWARQRIFAHRLRASFRALYNVI